MDWWKIEINIYKKKIKEVKKLIKEVNEYLSEESKINTTMSNKLFDIEVILNNWPNEVSLLNPDDKF